MIKYLSNNLWDNIRLLSENSKNQMVVVSPYVGRNIDNIIKFKENDILITSLTKSNVEQGNVDPRSVEKLIDNKVKVFSIENLHSKIYYFEESVIVGSSNLSENSKDYLFESGIWTDDKRVIKQIENELEELLEEEITLEYVQSLKEYYVPARTPFRGGINKPHSSDVWVISVISTDYTEEELELLKSKEEEYQLLLREGYEISDIRFEIDNSFINEVKIGESVIEVNQDEKKIYAPKKDLGIELGPKKNGKVKVKFLRLESEKHAKSFNIDKLKEELKLKTNF